MKCKNKYQKFQLLAIKKSYAVVKLSNSSLSGTFSKKQFETKHPVYVYTMNLFFFINFQVFVLLLSILVTLQQALSSGYLNSVITTIEKRYEIPSSISGIIASMYEIGNVITVIFVSYLGSRRHIPVWIGMGM